MLQSVFLGPNDSYICHSVSLIAFVVGNEASVVGLAILKHAGVLCCTSRWCGGHFHLHL